jgi:hypothetical protein
MVHHPNGLRHEQDPPIAEPVADIDDEIPGPPPPLVEVDVPDPADVPIRAMNEVVTEGTERAHVLSAIGRASGVGRCVVL